LRIVIAPPRRGIPTALWINIAKGERARDAHVCYRQGCGCHRRTQPIPTQGHFALPVDSRRKQYTKPKPSQLARAIYPLPTARGQTP
jgi:hypothetical protein